MIPQWRTEGDLAGALGTFGGAVEYGVTLTSFTQDATASGPRSRTDGAVEQVARFWSVRHGGQRRRKSLGLASRRGAEGQRLIAADVELEGLDRDGGTSGRSRRAACWRSVRRALRFQLAAPHLDAPDSGDQ